MKTIITGLAAGALALGAAFAPGTAGAQEKKITVLTWNIPYFEEGFQTWVDEFKELHPDFTVERLDRKGTEIPTFYQTQVVAGTPPDIVDIQGGLWLQYASEGGLTDLTPYLEEDQDYTERLYPEVLHGWDYEDGTYGVPLYISKTLLFLNRNLMQEAGVTEDPGSFEELMAAAEKMAGGQNSGLITLNFDWLYWPLFKMNGVDFVNDDLTEAAFNTPKMVDLVEQLADATDKGIIDPISWTGRWVEPNGAFAAGNVGMLHAHAPAFLWFKSKADWVTEDSVGAMNLPGGWATPNSHALVMSAGTDWPDVAWDFMKIATSGDGAYAMGTGTNNLTGDKITNEKLMDYFAEEIPAVVPVLETQLENLDKLTGNWPFAQDAAIKEAFYPELQSALLGEKDAQEALDAAESKVNRILRRQR